MREYKVERERDFEKGNGRESDEEEVERSNLIIQVNVAAKLTRTVHLLD